jgi:nucleoside-diphosphate-sugar epimerase
MRVMLNRQPLRILVTGSSGFIGKNLVDFLLKEGHSVRGLDKKKGKLRKDIPDGSLYEELIGNITREDILRRAVEDIDVVFHLASLVTQADVPESRYWEVNVGGTENLLSVCKDAGVKRFVYCSTDSVVGRIHQPPAKEADPPHPENIYGNTKCEAEKRVLEYSSRMSVVILRPTRVYGPGDWRMLEIFRRIKQKRFFLIGRGEALFHPVYISDCMQGFKLASEVRGAEGEIFHIGGAKPVKIRYFLETAARELGVRIGRIHFPCSLARGVAVILEKCCPILGITPPFTRRNLEFFTKTRSYDISKARKILGYNPEVGVEDGVKKTVQWYREKGYL